MAQPPGPGIAIVIGIIVWVVLLAFGFFVFKGHWS